MQRLHFVIRGRVQGVFFRAGAAELARTLRLTGWVRNRSDGSVEIVAEGETQALSALREWCERGPSGAHVEHVATQTATASGEFAGFAVRD